MNHFILTRFNLRLWEKDKNNAPVQTAEWLEKRFNLFETYCFPSILSQTCKDFKWICLFDIDTPDKYKNKIQGYCKLMKGFIPCFLGKEETLRFFEYFKEQIKQYADSNDENLITTYLDNDDCLRIDYIEYIQNLSTHSSHNTIFSFKYGLQYFTTYNLAVRIPYPNNHFLSYYEKYNSNIKTVWGFSHFYIFQYKNINFNCINNERNPMWIEVVHENNVDNDVKMTLSLKLISSKYFLNNYGINRILNRKASICNYIFKLGPRFINQVIRRLKNKIGK